jgi:16S rRNA (guanine1207-N2)-methyltransferase
MQFITDNGVFSKSAIDYGSLTLLRAFYAPQQYLRILDVGTGYGAIGITIAKLFPQAKVVLTEINERAVALARENAVRNQVQDRIEVLQGDGYEKVTGLFDVIVTNPPIRAGKSVVYRIFSKAYGYLNPGGKLWVVIQKKQGAPSTFAKLQDIYDDVVEVNKDKGYRVFLATKKK